MREKAKEFMAAVSLRFPNHICHFCTTVLMNELRNNQSIHMVAHENQV